MHEVKPGKRICLGTKKMILKGGRLKNVILTPEHHTRRYDGGKEIITGERERKNEMKDLVTKQVNSNIVST